MTEQLCAQTDPNHENPLRIIHTVSDKGKQYEHHSFVNNTNDYVNRICVEILPKHGDSVRIKTNYAGFTLSLKEARNLQELINEALKQFD